MKSIWGFLGILCLWTLSAIFLQKPFLPDPWQTIQAFPLLAHKYDLLNHVGISLWRIISSLVLALLFGVPFGYLCGRYPQVNKWAAPYLTFFYPLPKIVFLPILIVLFGLGNTPKIILLTLIVTFQIIIIVRDETMRLPNEWFILFQTMTTRQWIWIRHLYLPYLLPSIITGLRISLGTVIAVLFFSETFVAVNGLGYIILDTMESRNYPQMYASILILSSIGFLLYGLLVYGEKKTYIHQ